MPRTRRPFTAFKPRRPKDSRTIPLWDETEQGNGTFYICWHCGFTCNDKRDSLGGESTRNAVTHDDFTMQSTGAEPGEFGAEANSEYRGGGQLSATPVLNGLTHVLVAVRSDSDGERIEPVHYHDVNGAGCPFCHSQNWRGDF